LLSDSQKNPLDQLITFKLLDNKFHRLLRIQRNKINFSTYLKFTSHSDNEELVIKTRATWNAEINGLQEIIYQSEGRRRQFTSKETKNSRKIEGTERRECQESD